MDCLADAGSPGCLAASMPDGFLCDRLIGAARLQTGKQPAIPPPDRAVIDPQLVEEFRAERNLAVLAAFTLSNADYHAFLVDVLRTEMAHLGAAHAGRIERHQDGPMPQVAGGGNQTGDFIATQHDRYLAAQCSRQR